MKKNIGMFLLFIIPSIALASGSEVLSLMWSMLLVLILMISSLFFGKLSLKKKFLAFGIYMLTSVATLLATNDIPYLNNMYLINTVNTALPLLIWALIYVYLYKKSKT